MNNYLESLQDKSKELNEVANSENPIKDGKKLLRSLSEKKLLKNTKKGLTEFYSDENYAVVKAMLSADSKIVARPSNIKSNINSFNFFDIYKEIKFQEVLYRIHSKYIFMYEVEETRYKELSVIVKRLQAQLAAYAKKKGQTALYTKKLNACNKEIKDYADLISLIE